MGETVKVLFDTDIGTDIDDAVALTYLLRQPRCELLGITTVAGEPDKRAMLASAICREAGRDDVPIHPGTGRPMIVPTHSPRAEQAEALSKWPHRTDLAPNSAVEFMRRVIRAHPGEVTLLAVGPMTNVGLLLATDPEIAALLGRLVLMCGVFTTQIPNLPQREWNAWGDPHATAIVYAAEVRDHLSIGLDVTMQCYMPRDEVKAKFKRPPLNVVLDMADLWFRRADRITFHDPLAAAVIFEPDLCGYAEGKVEVELVSPPLYGMTRWTSQAEESPHQIALAVDAERFFQHYFSIVG
ncbi:MAG: nucleoside hydrolase [Phycisphaerae bacterium]|nr:nucleoside hydrolase [Phycisphaerae bacterium]